MSPESERLITDLIGAYLGPAGSGERHDATHALRAHIEELERDAARYRWLREQHEGHTDPLQTDADGLPMPMEPTAVAFTVFQPDGDDSLVPIRCMVGELDETIDAAMRALVEAK